jgi:hypothetical protein
VTVTKTVSRWKDLSKSAPVEDVREGGWKSSAPASDSVDSARGSLPRTDSSLVPFSSTIMYSASGVQCDCAT